MTAITQLTASQLIQHLRDGQLSAMEVVEAHLQQVAAHNPALNALVTLDAAAARARARQADTALAQGVDWGPLHGVPITIKDAFETAGMRTTSGYPPLADHIPSQDALLVNHLRQAGAILLGKTNLPTLASGIQTNNPVFGRTNNPWDLARTPGGSSGGSAAAVAAGLSPLDLGSDIGGSLRIPAHFCGIFGLKATGGRLSGQGHIASRKPLHLPKEWMPLVQLASFGPLARSVEDLRLGFQVLSGSGTPTEAAAPAKPLSALRVAWMDDCGGAPVSEETRRAMQQMALSLAQAGCQVERLAPAGFDYEDAWEVSGECLGAINTCFQSPWSVLLRRLGSPILANVLARHPLMLGLFKGMALQPQRVTAMLKRREALVEQVEQFLGEWDAWLCPVFPTPAFSHRSNRAAIEVDDRQEPQLLANLLHAVIFNVTGHPVVVLPLKRSATALPLGVQIIGRRWKELPLLAVASQLDQVLHGYHRPPGY